MAFRHTGKIFALFCRSLSQNVIHNAAGRRFIANRGNGSSKTTIPVLLFGGAVGVGLGVGGLYYNYYLAETERKPILSHSVFQPVYAAQKVQHRERTFIMIKPDGVQRRLIADITKRFEQKGFKLVAMKFLQPSRELLNKHYEDLSSKPFFPGLINYMTSGPVVAMVWEGEGAVKTGRVMLGETHPEKSLPGTIRGDYCIQVGRNIIHGSDSVESANTEIGLWFQPKELVDWKPELDRWINEQN